MQEEYIKEKKIKEKTKKEKEEELLKSIVEAREELKMLRKNFDMADVELVDYYSYQLKASQSKLDYLIRFAKNNGISLDMIEEIKIKLFSQRDEVV